MSPTELLAALLSALGVWLTTRRQMLCWPVSLVASLLYLWIFARVKLWADAGLQAVFVALLLYGWELWHEASDTGGLPVARPSARQIGVGLVAGAVAGLCLWQGLGRWTADPVPFADAFLTAFSLVGQFWTARRWRESWLIWIAADTGYTALFLAREMYPTAVLYAVFTVLAVSGYRKWTSPSP
ncbi:nicotinamide riboside transporter PnuC [Acetobacter sp. AN02]|uniref:nicotinamide riboside transporter PnuC n=1 Tax=Acetobacter sp. AN02 TaxID=2894186 RepID=UPI0024343EBD|nr:nicotinamide riboside transporter PnuC [Acetobacter sp. AN02]MDG6094483.1 nicotinamide riboside transporter PnuC [Acetobacter sp. AN02]